MADFVAGGLLYRVGPTGMVSRGPLGRQVVHLDYYHFLGCAMLTNDITQRAPVRWQCQVSGELVLGGIRECAIPGLQPCVAIPGWNGVFSFTPPGEASFVVFTQPIVR